MTRGLRIQFPVDLPTWRSGQSVNEWREISNTKISSTPTYLYGASGGTISKVLAWVGWSIDQRTSKVYSVSNGGHDNYWGNEVDVCDLEQNAPAWIEMLTSSAQVDVTLNSDHYSDGRPASRHSYHTQQFIESLNRAVMVGVGSKSKSGNPGLPSTHSTQPRSHSTQRTRSPLCRSAWRLVLGPWRSIRRPRMSIAGQ
jgi:hypothetical protein